MNCPHCGAVLLQGAWQCHACGMLIAGMQDYPGQIQQNEGYPQGFDPTAYRHSSAESYYPQPVPGQHSYPPGYDTGAYPQGYNTGGYPPVGAGQSFDPGSYGAEPYSQGYGGYPQHYQAGYARQQGGALMASVTYLPRLIIGVIRDPGEVLQGLMERADRFTGGIIVVLALLMTFLSGMAFTRGAIATLFGGLSDLLGMQLAGNAASMNQGINYIAGRIAASVGGIAVLSQLIAIVLPATVALVYLCVMRKVRFSFLLASNLIALTTLPTIAAALLCMLLSLLSPILGLAAIGLGLVVSYVFLCLMVSRIIGLPEPHSATVKIALVSVSEIVKLLFVQLIGGALLASTLRTVSSLMNTIGSLL